MKITAHGSRPDQPGISDRGKQFSASLQDGAVNNKGQTGYRWSDFKIDGAGPFEGGWNLLPRWYSTRNLAARAARKIGLDVRGLNPKANPKAKTKARKANPLGLTSLTPQGVALHLVGSKVLRKGNPGYTQHGATEDLFGGASRLTPRRHSDISRPRVKVRGGTVTFAEGSPYKGKVRKANPATKVVRKPLVLVLDSAESKAIKKGGSTVAMVRKAFAAAKESGKDGWDHIVVQHPGGAVAFTLIP